MADPFRAVAVVTAAGSAERFGGRKLFADIEGDPLIDRTINALVNGGIDHIFVVVPPDCQDFLATPMISARIDTDVHLLVNNAPHYGMFSSIKIGFAASDAEAVLVLPGDMPFVQHETVRALVSKFRERTAIVSPRYRGKRGHPVVLPWSLRDEIRNEPSDSNLHNVIKRHQDMRVDLDVDDAGVVRDVDIPADLGRPSS